MIDNTVPCAQCGVPRGQHKAGTLNCPMGLTEEGWLVKYSASNTFVAADNPLLRDPVAFSVFSDARPTIMPGIIRDMNSGLYQRRMTAPRPGNDKPDTSGGIPIGGQISPRGRPVGQDRDGFRGKPPMPWEDVTVMIQNLRELELHDVAAVLEAEDQERKRLAKAVDNLQAQMDSMADQLRRIDPEHRAMKKIITKLQQSGVDVKAVATNPAMVEKLLGRKDIDVTTPKELKQIKETIRSLDFEDD